MSVVKKTYSVTNVRQLIDLNGDSTNFELTFTVTSHNKEPFDVVVVDQTMLDNNADFNYQHAQDGIISGTIKRDQNIYQNYSLILKSEVPCDCDVEIQKKDLPVVKVEPKPVESKKNWFKYVLIFLLIVGVGGLLYWFSKKKDNKEATHVVNNLAPRPTMHIEHSPSPSLVSNKSSPKTSPVKVAPVETKNPLLERLKKLQI